MSSEQIEREIDMALAWARRIIALEEKVEHERQAKHHEGQWLRAYDNFILEKRDIGEHRTVRDAVRAFYSEKGYGLP